MQLSLLEDTAKRLETRHNKTQHMQPQIHVCPVEWASRHTESVRSRTVSGFVAMDALSLSIM
jgi:hypothetical protein